MVSRDFFYPGMLLSVRQLKPLPKKKCIGGVIFRFVGIVEKPGKLHIKKKLQSLKMGAGFCRGNGGNGVVFSFFWLANGAGWLDPAQVLLCLRNPPW